MFQWSQLYSDSPIYAKWLGGISLIYLMGTQNEKKNKFVEKLFNNVLEILYLEIIITYRGLYLAT